MKTARACPDLPNVDMARLTALRRELHAYPEIGFQEIETAKRVCTQLDALGISYETGLAGTGIVATVKGTTDSDRIIGLRAELDALPMRELNLFDYRSKHPGAMHGCGHDGHMCLLLGLAETLVADRDFAGTVRLIFQPAEEGLSGGLRMIEDGLFDRFDVTELYAIHNWPDLPHATVGIMAGPVMAAGHVFRFSIRGKGGHGGMPHLATDQLAIGAHVLTALNTFSARTISPNEAVVISMTKVEAGTAQTVLPEVVTFEGVIRFFDDGVAEKLYTDLPKMIEHIAAAFGATAEVSLTEVYPVTVNDAVCADKVARVATDLGMEVETTATGLKPAMASEDFSFMLQHRPGAYIWLGQNSQGLHHPEYDFADTILAPGIRLLRGLIDAPSLST